jgi:hypothetical protein
MEDKGELYMPFCVWSKCDIFASSCTGDMLVEMRQTDLNFPALKSPTTRSDASA